MEYKRNNGGKIVLVACLYNLYVLHGCKFVLFLMVSNHDDFLVEKRLMDEVRSHNILIIVGETGSGKTTRKLLFLSL